jgi:hypothetical protein
MQEPTTPAAPRSAAELVRQLQALWEQGQQPDPDALLRAAGVSSPAEVAEVLAADQWQRWHAGQRLSVEDYLVRHPALAADPTALLALAYGEFLLREELGEGPTPAEYLARFPQCADGLGRQFEFHGAFAQPSPAVHDGDPGAVKAVPAVPAVPGYELLGEVGRGGMGVVYKARQTGLHRLVAVKMLRAGVEAGPDELARFRTEAEAVARLHHPNIVQIFEVGEADGRPFLSLEFVDGCGLHGYLAGTPQPPQAAAALVEVLARAMAVAHQHGIVHRDLKPSNILLGSSEPGTEDNRGPSCLFPKITDFGLAKLLPGAAPAAALDQQTHSGTILGTPSYMAPEQARGRSKEVGPAADVYALGAILYECLTGRPPFKAESALETLQQVLQDEPVPPSRLRPRLPRDLEIICLKCLRKEPTQRYESAAALADDLQRWQRGEPIHARPTPAVRRLALWVGRRPAQAALYAVSGLAVLTLVALAVGLSYSARLDKANSDLKAAVARAEGRELLARRLRYAADMRVANRLFDERNLPRLEERPAPRRPRRRGPARLRVAPLVEAGPRRSERPLAVTSWGRALERFFRPRRRQPVDHRHSGRGPVVGRRNRPGSQYLAGGSGRGCPLLLQRGRQGPRGSTAQPGGRGQAVVSHTPSRAWRNQAIEPSALRVVPQRGRECAGRGQLLATLYGHRRQPDRLCFRRDGRRLASCCRYEKTIKLWDLQTGQDVLTLRCESAGSMAFSPDGYRLATAGFGGDLWDATPAAPE